MNFNFFKKKKTQPNQENAPIFSAENLKAMAGQLISLSAENIRAMAGAVMQRMENWTNDIMTMKFNGEIMLGLVRTLDKARGLALNDPIIRAYLSACRKNIIGRTGFELQSQLKNAEGALDEAVNDEIEWLWYEWGKASKGELTIDGGMRT